MKETSSQKALPAILAALVLLPGALQGWLVTMPEGYFTFLKIAVCGVAAYLAWQALKENKSGWMWIFIFAAFLYNPLVPVYFNQPNWAWDTWPSIDIGMILLLIGFAGA